MGKAVRSVRSPGRGLRATLALAAAVAVASVCAAPAGADGYPTPGAPALTVGTSPSASGVFTLGWSGADPLEYVGLGYTLEHHDAATEEWSTLASGIEALSFETSGEGEGTWVYRVQASDGAGQTSEFSPESAPVVVDETPPAAPTASADRAPDFTGGGGWYRDSVEVSFAANGDPALADGSPGSGVEPASLSAPQTFQASGSHTASATVADNAGNVSSAGVLAVQVDATPPSLEVQCPSNALLGEAHVSATVTASDGQSGLAVDPSAVAPIDTSAAGPVTVMRTAVDNVGHETTASCTTQVGYPTPGAPALTVGTSPSASGVFTLGWSGADPLEYVGLGYTLEHHDAATEEWSTLASGIEALSFETSGEGEGTWVYRVQASDGAGQTSEFSPESAPVVVDETPPAAPTASADRAPDFTGGGGWYRDSVEVSFAANGDPALADGSPGSGVEPASLSAPQTFQASGSHTASATVADNAGNVSAPGTLAVQVDATPPSVEVECPATALVGEGGVVATVTASDGESGLAVDPSGTVHVDTAHAGPVTVTRTAVDNVGHETTRSCTTQVGYPTPGAPALTSGTSPNASGLFTLSWSGADPASYPGLGYTLEHHDASTQTWSTVASGIEAPSHAFTGAGEEEGTWVYRVQGVDSAHGQTTAHSPQSAPIVVDETPPNAPTASATRAPDYADGGGWYKDSVTVSFAAAGDRALKDGSPGSGVEPASLSAPQTFQASGSHTASGTVADNAGNVSAPGTLSVQVDATPPTIEVQCPETAVVGEADATATVSAFDGQSGLASDPSGTVPIDTTQAGAVTTTRTAADHVGHERSASCTTQVLHYVTPGAPSLTSGTSPNNQGLFTLSWSGADPQHSEGLTYTLQHHNAASETWSTVASGIGALSYTFSGAGEGEGTWVYRVQGVDSAHSHTTAYSPTSAPVVVDRTAPSAPTAKADRAPDYTGGGGWYRDSVTVSFTSHGDPALTDTSPGSGVNPASLTAPQTLGTSGSHTASGTVADLAGNVSAPGTLVVQVDTTAPSLEVQCPATVAVGAAATATVTASDLDSGLARDPSGSVPIDTHAVGSVTTTRTAADNVGHETTRSCTTKVLESPPEFGRCVTVPSEKVSGKTVYHGLFTASTCLVQSATHTGKYEWVSGVVKTGFTTTLGPGTNVVFESTKRQKLTCTGETGTGTITGAKSVGNVLLRFTNCFTGELKCTSPGRAHGELETSQLEGVLGIERTAIKSGKETRYVGLDLYPVGHTGPFIQYTCGARPATMLIGSVIGVPLTDKQFATGSVKYAQTAGKQKPEHLEGEPTDVLTFPHGEQVGFPTASPTPTRKRSRSTPSSSRRSRTSGPGARELSSRACARRASSDAAVCAGTARGRKRAHAES